LQLKLAQLLVHTGLQALLTHWLQSVFLGSDRLFLG
jgi:hypothetical protein